MKKTQLLSPGRTEGDGMENEGDNATETVSFRNRRTALGDKLIYRPTDFKESTPVPPIIKGQIVNLVPSNTVYMKKDKLLNSLKTKEPKFVPFEPYKAAVKPIVPVEKRNKVKDGKISRKCSMDVKPVCSAVSDIVIEKEKVIEESKTVETSSIYQDQPEWLPEKKAMQEEIKTLKEENGQLESQLKFQAQVNAELKTLLVAAVGEDIEMRVHLLTEDKLQLARALLNSAQRLSTHQEQTDWLAGQCEVWRSKFLASSLMVEELARWKAALCQKATELQEGLKRMLEERPTVRDSLLRAYTRLAVLRKNFDHPANRTEYLSSTNILDLSVAVDRLSEVLLQQFLGSCPDQRKIYEPDFTGLETRTQAERSAENLLLNPNPLLLSGHPDAACSAVMGAAVAVGGHLLMGPNTVVPGSCSHCSGETKFV
ncbi:golgin-45 [Schistocerca nitens]|uniref:golgin-45 n=1 Tax=Schistocerca nitens TaxID=7011 RepID=UPI002118784C|nr:golgin-45 [Schistocerca nitens]XP_049801536.1 golgin-45 [Schistocerca nitens]